jgi:hypothetical protein
VHARPPRRSLAPRALLDTPSRRNGLVISIGLGFNAVAGRLSAALGPLVFGAMAAASGSQAAALVSLIAFLAAGVGVLSTLRIPAPRVVTAAPAGARGG